MKKIFFIFLLLNNYIYGQWFDNNFLMENPDKVTISSVYFQDKTFVELANGEEIETIIKKLDEQELSQKEIKKLIRLIKKKYKKAVPLPYHYDIQLDFYKEGRVVQLVRVSSETKKLTLEQVDCPYDNTSEIEHWGKCLYMSVMSKKLEKYIQKILNKNKF